MEALIISTSDIEGGCGRAAYRLHQGLRQRGMSSRMLVREKLSDDRAVTAEKTLRTRLGATVESLPLKQYPQRDHTLFSSQWFPDQLAHKVAQLNPDLINLHWACSGFLQIETLPKLKQPVVWTLHDMWAFTGGCHYTQECDRYQQSCGNCPQLHSQKSSDLSHQIWQRKAKAWSQNGLLTRLTIVTPSQWLAHCVRSSSLFRQVRVEVIPNGLDTELYRPLDQRAAREILRLPQNKKLILFGALGATSDERKGFQLLQPALQSLRQSSSASDIELVIFGASRPEKPPELGFPIHYLGRLNDDLSLVLVYSAADVFVAPSRQDNLPNTVVEAIACGTPCAAFKVGGMPDILQHEYNGFLAQPFDTADLARGIDWILGGDRHQQLRHQARQTALTGFTLPLQAQRYSALFQDVLSLQSH
jgi:glycosyltransferase involved in cell wall biosynthesis